MFIETFKIPKEKQCFYSIQSNISIFSTSRMTKNNSSLANLRYHHYNSCLLLSNLRLPVFSNAKKFLPLLGKHNTVLVWTLFKDKRYYRIGHAFKSPNSLIIYSVYSIKPYNFKSKKIKCIKKWLSFWLKGKSWIVLLLKFMFSLKLFFWILISGWIVFKLTLNR